MYIPKKYLTLFFIPEALKYLYQSHDVKYHTSIFPYSRPILGQMLGLGCTLSYANIAHGQNTEEILIDKICVVYGGCVFNSQHSYGYKLCSSSRQLFA